MQYIIMQNNVSSISTVVIAIVDVVYLTDKSKQRVYISTKQSFVRKAVHSSNRLGLHASR